MLVLSLVAVQFAYAEQERRAKVLLIGKKPDHPFGTHMYMHTQKMLAKCLERTKGVKTVVSSQVTAGHVIVMDSVPGTGPASSRLLDLDECIDLDLGWTPAVGIDQGLDRLAAWFATRTG